MKMFYIVVKGENSRAVARRIVTELNIRDPRAVMEGCDAPLKHLLATALNVKFDDLPMDSPIASMHGFTPSEIMNKMRDFMQEQYGADVFGRLWVFRHLRETPLIIPVKYGVLYNLTSEADMDALDRFMVVDAENETWDAVVTKRCVADIMDMNK
jgi:hypothetical protein